MSSCALRTTLTDFMKSPRESRDVSVQVLRQATVEADGTKTVLSVMYDDWTSSLITSAASLYTISSATIDPTSVDKVVGVVVIIRGVC